MQTTETTPEQKWNDWTNTVWESASANLGGNVGMVVLEQQTMRSSREKLCCSCGNPGTKPQQSRLILSVKTYYLCADCDAHYNSK